MALFGENPQNIGEFRFLLLTLYMCTWINTYTVRSWIGRLHVKTLNWALCLVVLCSHLEQARKVHTPTQLKCLLMKFRRPDWLHKELIHRAFTEDLYVANLGLNVSLHWALELWLPVSLCEIYRCEDFLNFYSFSGPV